MSKSVAVTLLGGLGNQMFEYALGRNLSIRLGLPLVLDLSSLRVRPKGWVPRKYDLGLFQLSGQQLRDSPIFLARARNRLARILGPLGIGWTRMIEELPLPDTLAFDPEVLQVDGPCQLIGFWQSERYFESIAPQLRQDFAFLPGGDAQSQDFESRIRSVKSVGINYRRTDYVKSSLFSALTADYYNRALDLVVSRIGADVELFIFSDDVPWCRENVRFPYPTNYMDWPGMNHTREDLRLMSACRALVMANSTFSWWAGWLNPRPDKVIVAPKNWVKRPDVACDLIHSKWLTAI